MAQLVSPSRVPFGMLNDSRLQQLTNVKNKQNAIAAPSSILSKRKASSDAFASDADSENVDPSYTSPKKSKLSSGFAAFSKPSSHFILKTDSTSSLLSQPPSIATRSPATPKRSSLTSPLDVTPRTAPAGRSPRRKRAGLGGKRRTSAPFTRINPPTFGGSSVAGLPFSIDAALAGSLPSYQPAPASSSVAAWESKVEGLGSASSRSSWFFDIHEDTPEEELGNLMEFSTQTLDISDEESKADKRRREMEERGKENIPPEMLGSSELLSMMATSSAVVTTITAVPSNSRKDMMTDEPRTPLGELETKEFYADGCDADSVVIVPADGEGEDVEQAAKTECADVSPTEAKSSVNQDTWRELLARVDEQQQEEKKDEFVSEQQQEQQQPPLSPVPEQIPLPPSDDDQSYVDVWAVEATSREEAPLFEIWESESAKEEAEEQELCGAAVQY